MKVATLGHGTRPLDELIEVLRGAGAVTLVDVRRFPGSRRNPQFAQRTLAGAVTAAGMRYVHALELGGRLAAEPGEERFSCVRKAPFRSYLARMTTPEWHEALAAALAEPAPCFLCAETLPWRCHRHLIGELLHARGHQVVHLIAPGQSLPHQPWPQAETRDGRLYVCSELVA